jgi:hypothetical protein
VEVPGRQPVRRPGTYGFYVDAGYYIAVRSLPASERTIHFQRVPSGLEVYVTHDVTVVRRH